MDSARAVKAAEAAVEAVPRPQSANSTDTASQEVRWESSALRFKPGRNRS